jgi:hypothetical protein
MGTRRPRIDIVDVTSAATFALVPPCADPGFDHRSCDYWENADRGSKAARLDWLTTTESTTPVAPARPSANPFLADLEDRAANPFAPPGAGGGASNPFLTKDDLLADNPFAPRTAPAVGIPATAPRKLQLLGRGLAVAGSYAKVLLVDDEPVAYCQFGPLTAYPRAQRTRELYPALPDAPLPAVITCIATTTVGRSQGHARRLVGAVCDDLADRGFAAVETFPEIGADPDRTSAATPAFWVAMGFEVAAADVRFPVMRRELA